MQPSGSKKTQIGKLKISKEKKRFVLNISLGSLGYVHLGAVQIYVMNVGCGCGVGLIEPMDFFEAKPKPDSTLARCFLHRILSTI